jgi:hypothetical protein
MGMGFLARLFGRRSKIRINPTSSLNEEERKLSVYIGLTLELTYPVHNEAQLIEDVSKKFGIDAETARWWIQQTISALKDAGRLKG